MQSFFMWTIETDQTVKSQAGLSLHWVHMSEGMFSHDEAHIYFFFLGPVLQSIVSLMSLYVVKMLTVLVSTISNS